MFQSHGQGILLQFKRNRTLIVFLTLLKKKCPAKYNIAFFQIQRPQFQQAAPDQDIIMT